MTRKHFEAAAALVRNTRDRTDKGIMASAYATLFAQFNPRFDRGRFYSACGLEAYCG